MKEKTSDKKKEVIKLVQNIQQICQSAEENSHFIAEAFTQLSMLYNKYYQNKQK